MQSAAVFLVTDPTLHKSWWGASHGGTHVKRAPHDEGGDGGTGGGFADGQTLPFSSIGRFLSTHVYGKAPGAPVPNPTFIVGKFSDANVAKIAKFIDGFESKHATLRVSGYSLKHTDESRHDVLAAVINELPEIASSPDLNVLRNLSKSRDNSAMLVYKRPNVEGPNALVVIEISKNGTGTDIANMISAGDRQLKQYERRSSEWLEGRHSLIQVAEGNPAVGVVSDVHPSGDLTIPKNLNKSMPSRLVVFSKELPMNQFDLLKSHIDAYTRKDGAVVQAHDDSRVAKQFNPGDKVHFPNPHKSDGSSAEGVYVGKREGRHVISHQDEEWEDDYPTLSDKPFGPKPKKEPYKPSEESKKMAAYHSKTADHHYSLAEKHKGNVGSNHHLKAAIAHDAASNSHKHGGGIARPSEMSDLAEQESKFANQAKK